MKRVALVIQMQNLDAAKFGSIKKYMDKLQSMHHDIMQARNTISSKDMVILLMSHLPLRYDMF